MTVRNKINTISQTQHLPKYEYVLIAPEYIRILSYKSMNKV